MSLFIMGLTKNQYALKAIDILRQSWSTRKLVSNVWSIVIQYGLFTNVVPCAANWLATIIVAVLDIKGLEDSKRSHPSFFHEAFGLRESCQKLYADFSTWRMEKEHWKDMFFTSLLFWGLPSESLTIVDREELPLLGYFQDQCCARTCKKY